MDPYQTVASQLATISPLLTAIAVLSLLGFLAALVMDYAGPTLAPAPTIGGWERDIRAAVIRRRLTLEPSALSVRSWRACQRASACGRSDLAERAIGAWCAGDYRRALSLAGASVRWAPVPAVIVEQAPIVMAPEPEIIRAPPALVPVLNYRRPALFAPPAPVVLLDESPPVAWRGFGHPIAIGGVA